MNPRVALLPAAVLLVGGGIALYTRGGSPARPDAKGVEQAEAPRGADRLPWHPQNVRLEFAPRTERFPCVVRTPKPVFLLPPIPLTPVDRVLVQKGTAVRKGDLLLTLGAAQWERVLAEAEKAGNGAKAAEARKALDSLEVRAPEDGIVHSIEARRGEIPLRRKEGPLPLVTLYDWHLLTYEGTAPASLAEILDRSPQVFVRSGKDPPVEAEILRNGPRPPDGSVPLVLRPIQPPVSVPEPGDEGEILVMVGAEEVTAVPRAAVRTEGGRPQVHIVTVTGELVPRTVVLGLPIGLEMIAVSGVKMGESVAVWE